MKRIALVSLLFSLLVIWPVAADCPNGTSGDDIIVCDTDRSDQLQASGGDDHVTINDGVTVDNNVLGGNG